MSIDLARQGRRNALRMRHTDRKLIPPAPHLYQVKLPQKGSLDASLLLMLHRGISIEKLCAKTGWSASDAMMQIFQIVKRAKLGLERRNGNLYLVYPEADLGSSHDASTLRDAVQAHRSDAYVQPGTSRNAKVDATLAV